MQIADAHARTHIFHPVMLRVSSMTDGPQKNQTSSRILAPVVDAGLVD